MKSRVWLDYRERGDNNNPIKIFPDCVRVSADERQIKTSAGEGWG